MAKKVQITCDRCEAELTPANWTISDREVCDDCQLLAEMAAEYTAQDVLNNAQPGTTLTNLLNHYGQAIDGQAIDGQEID